MLMFHFRHEMTAADSEILRVWIIHKHSHRVRFHDTHTRTRGEETHYPKDAEIAGLREEVDKGREGLMQAQEEFRGLFAHLKSTEIQPIKQDLQIKTSKDFFRVQH